ncbi:glycosyltransferase [Geotalea sp. SG265]|uniref:rhamnosyltransferase WsaF family glycosyltransferase n=1 Tax=Geotalea sp. SG265 TaxID=2922867 RepID=UPI001FAF15CD|nr:glycosyltransferase [Geotalea sp. SG265]
MIKLDIETRLPTQVRLKNRNRYLIEGWIYGKARIKNLFVLVENKRFEADNIEIFRSDVITKHYYQDSECYSAFSGFSVPVILDPVSRNEIKDVVLQATFKNGENFTHHLGTIELSPWKEKNLEIKLPDSVSADRLLVICMASYNPKQSLFQRQVESIIAQDYQNWICIVCDDNSKEDIKLEMRRLLSQDPRFIFIEHSKNVGFYNNFERCLEAVPNNAKYVALADQDDYWYPNKLSKCIDKINGKIQLAYCDMKIVGENGTIISDTYWKNRTNYYGCEDIDLLAIANTVTGAASVFRASLLENILPFPPRYGAVYHDQWIAVLALMNGGIAYVDLPLYDYMQSDSNIIGHYDFPNISLSDFFDKHFFNDNYMANIKPLPLTKKARALFSYTIRWSHNFYFFPYREGKFMTTIINTARLRVPNNPLEPLLMRSRTFWGLIKMRHKVNTQRKSANNNELSLLIANIVNKIYACCLPFLRPLLSRWLAKQQNFLSAVNNIDPWVLEFKRKFSDRRFAVVDKLQQINVLLPSLDPANFFGGYIGMFNFAKKFAEAGYSVRIVITDQDKICSANLDKIKTHDQSLNQFLSKVEFVACYDSEQILSISDDDIFVATSWWTAHIAHEAALHTRYRKFIYLEQDYEPIFYEHGAYRVLAEMSYKFDFYPVFSTQLLQDFFIESRISPHNEAGAYFNNPVLKFDLDGMDLRRDSKGKKKLLFYGRPQPYNSRNLYPIGCLAIDRAGELGHFQEDEWEVIAIGGDVGEQILPSGIKIKHIGKFDLEKYRDILPQHDLGLALMDSPHPSLLPIEMASAGLFVVTNTYGIKNKEFFSHISENIMAVPPDHESLAQALISAAERVGDLEQRLAGSKVNWPHEWNDALSLDIIEKAVTAIKNG